MKVCAEPGCPTPTASSRCPAHTRSRELRRGSRQARGYTTAHDRERARWTPLVASGNVTCARCRTPIATGEPWHLDHDAARTGYLGPSHTHCNLSAAGRAAHDQRRKAR